MTRHPLLLQIADRKLIAILRDVPTAKTLPLVRALHKGGIRILEFTFDHSGRERAEETCEKVLQVKNTFGHEMLIGCGTVLSAAEANAAAAAGAQLMIAPHTDAALIRLGKSLGMVCIPGAFTPTEIMAAYTAGADFVKLFPAGVLGLPYIKAIAAPLPHIPLLAVGGVRPETVGGFLSAGIAGFGVGGPLVDPTALAENDYPRITELARAFSNAVAAWEDTHESV